MTQTFNELAFSPTMQEIISLRPEAGITILTGSNNSGESAYLKKTVANRDFLYVGVNRFIPFIILHRFPIVF